MTLATPTSKGPAGQFIQLIAWSLLCLSSFPLEGHSEPATPTLQVMAEAVPGAHFLFHDGLSCNRVQV